MPPITYVIRHGLTDWNAEGRFQGQADTDINDIGRRQAEANGKALKRLVGDVSKFDFVASPLKRTCQTMRLVRAAMGLDPDDFRTDPRLMELHFGDWQGLTMAEQEARQPGSMLARADDKWNFVPPGPSAESYAMLARRIAPWLDELSLPTICVAHGGVVRSIFRLVGGYTEQEAAALDIPQDRILVMDGGELRWH